MMGNFEVSTKQLAFVLLLFVHLKPKIIDQHADDGGLKSYWPIKEALLLKKLMLAKSILFGSKSITTSRLMF